MILALVLSMVSEPFKVVYAAGYIPNVQFAPFYVAQARGYYREAGLDVSMDYTIGPDVLKLVALNKVQFASADPDAFLHGAVAKLPLVHLATLYQRYPIALISKRDILDAKNLKGKRIGISGTYGSSYLGLKAILADMGLRLKDVNVASIGFTQVAALLQDRTDVVVGYVNNEPVRLRHQGHQIYTRTFARESRIPGVGLMTNPNFLKENPKVVTAFLTATFRGMNDIIQDPKTCFQLVVDGFLPELKNSERFETEFEILMATIPFWGSDYVNANGYGQCDTQLWANLVTTLQTGQKQKGYERWRQWVNRDFHWIPPAATP